MRPEGACYVVFRGRVPGIYATWEAVLAQVDGFSRNLHLRYRTYEEALNAWNEYFQVDASPVQARLTGMYLAAEIPRTGSGGRRKSTATRHTPHDSGTNRIYEFFSFLFLRGQSGVNFAVSIVLVDVVVAVAVDPSVQQLQEAVASLESHVSELEKDRMEIMAQKGEMLRQLADVLSQGKTLKYSLN